MPLRRRSPLADIDENPVEIGHPKQVARRRDATHYEPIGRGEAFELIGQTLRGHKSDVDPDHLS